MYLLGGALMQGFVANTSKISFYVIAVAFYFILFSEFGLFYCLFLHFVLCGGAMIT